jgi:hypothetical protein
MGLVEKVVDLLLQIEAADMVGAAGFEAVEAANADEAIGVLENPPRRPPHVHRYPDAGSMDGLNPARGRGAGGLRSRLSLPPAISMPGKGT